MDYHTKKIRIMTCLSILILSIVIICPSCAAEATYTENTFETSDITDQDAQVFDAGTGDGITITTECTSFALGDEIVISGINDNTNTTWLFLKGTNLASNGVLLINPQTSVVTGGTTSWGFTWDGETVQNDSTWQFIWDTRGIALDPGAYTIYATTTPTAYGDLESACADYSFTSLTFTVPQLTVTIPHRSYITGEEIPITGTATGNPTQGILIWILADNYRFMSTESLLENGSYDYTFNTTYSGEGEYTLFVQHPMYNDLFDVMAQANNPYVGQTSVVRPILDYSLANAQGMLPPRFILSGMGSLKYPDVADALEAELSAPAIDDTYIRETFLIGSPWITIDVIPETEQGDITTITGQTNLPAGNIITISTGLVGTNTTAVAGNAIVSDGEGFNNTWSFNLDTTGWVASPYTLTAASVTPEAETTSEFTLLESEPSVLSITIPLSPGWNLISVPVENATIRTDEDLYPTVYCYNSGSSSYEEVPLASMSTSCGYWVGSYTEANITFTGDVTTEYSVPASSGWNMIGSVSMDTPCTCIQPDAGSVNSVYAYDPEGKVYFLPGTLTPGSGNWVKSAEDCNLTVSVTPPSPPA